MQDIYQLSLDPQNQHVYTHGQGINSTSLKKEKPWATADCRHQGSLAANLFKKEKRSWDEYNCYQSNNGPEMRMFLLLFMEPILYLKRKFAHKLSPCLALSIYAEVEVYCKERVPITIQIYMRKLYLSSL